MVHSEAPARALYEILCTIRYRLFTLALFIIPTTYLLLTMPQTLYHRTTIGDARTIVKDGFENQKWRFENDDGTGEVKKAVGVWLSDRPLDGEEGPPGDAILEVDGFPITTFNEMVVIIGSHVPGDSMTLKIEHDGEVREETVELKLRPVE